jgi:hypothetical protein
MRMRMIAAAGASVMARVSDPIALINPPGA